MIIKTDGKNRISVGQFEVGPDRRKFEPNSHYEVVEVDNVLVLVPVKIEPEPLPPETIRAVEEYSTGSRPERRRATSLNRDELPATPEGGK